VSFVSLADPGGDLVDDCLFVGDAPFETLRGEESEFGFGQLLGGLVQTNDRSVWVARPRITDSPSSIAAPDAPLALGGMTLAASTMPNSATLQTPSAGLIERGGFARPFGEGCRLPGVCARRRVPTLPPRFSLASTPRVLGDD
jgi:hypothetical protein